MSSPSDLILGLYSNLMETGMTLNQIDEMDIMFYLDILIFQMNKAELETIRKYDQMGL